MRLTRFATLMNDKYDLVAEGADYDRTMAEVKRDIIRTYNLYVNSASPDITEPVLQMLKDAGEPVSKSLVNDFETLVANLKAGAGTVEQIFKSVNKILGDINVAKKSRSVREFIHDNTPSGTSPQRNYRERLKSKYEMVVSRISSIFKKQAEILNEILLNTQAISGGRVKPERQELSRDQMWAFIHGHPVAGQYGLDNKEVFAKIYDDLELRDNLTTLIYAAKRDKHAKDTSGIVKAVKELMDLFRLKQTNEEALEQERDRLQEQTRLQQIKDKNDRIFEKNKSLEDDPKFMAEQQKMQEAEEAYRKEREEEERQKAELKQQQEREQEQRRIMWQGYRKPKQSSMNDCDQALISAWIKKRGWK